MTRGLIVFLFILIAVLAAALVAPNFVDWNKYKDPIINQVKAATGYDVTIGGDLDMAVLPFPRVNINDLSVTVPGEAQPLLSLKTVAVNVALAPLFKKELHVNSVELRNPMVNLAIGADGQPVWMTENIRTRMQNGRGQTRPETEEGLAITLDSLRIIGGHFTLEDRRTNKKTVLQEIDAQISAQSLAGPFALTGGARYAGTMIRADIKSAKLDGGNAPVNGTIQLPDAGGTFTFAGVAGLKDGQFELQGETGFKAANLAQVIKALTGAQNDALAKAIDTQGVITFANNALDARNLKLSYGGQEMTGAVNIADLRARPLAVNVTANAAKNVDLRALLPAAAPKPAGAATAAPKTADFIPAQLALPVDAQVKAEVKLAGMSFDKIALRNVVLTLDKNAGRIGWNFAAEAMGGKIADKGNLTYAKAEDNGKGGVTYADPKMQLATTLEGIDVEDVLTPFLKPDQLKALAPIITETASGQIDAVITPKKITANPARLNIGKDSYTYSLNYTAAARPLVELALGADSFDAGRWLQTPQQAGQQAAVAAQQAATQDAKTKFVDAVKKFKLPVDMKITLALKDVAMRGAKYDDVFFVGKVTGDRLEIERAGLRDAAQNNLSITGTVGSINNLRDIDMTIGANTPDALKMLTSFNVDTRKLPQNIGRAELSSEFKGQADNLSFVLNLKAMQGALESSGALTDLLSKPKVGALNLRLRHPSYVDVMRIFNPNFSSGVTMRKSLDLFASMKHTGTTYSLTDMQATIGDIRATGTVDVNMAGTRPAVKGALQFGHMPIDELLGIQTGTRGTVRAKTNVPSANTGDVRWSRNAINTAGLWAFDMDMTATAQSVSYGEWKVEGADLAVTIKDGALTVSRLNGKIGGGTMAMNAGVKSSGKERQPVTVNAQAKFTDVELEQLVRGFSGARLIRARGPVSMDLNVNSAGISPAALIFALRGTGSASGKDLVIEGFDLPRLSRTLAAPSSSGSTNINNLIGATMSGGSTSFTSFYTDLAITEGVVTFPKFKLEGAESVITMEGNVNLPLWTVDLTTNVQLTEPENAPPLRVSFKGPLDNPGQTFGQSAMESYLQQMIGSRVQDAIERKLDQVLDGRLQGLIGGGAANTNNPTRTIPAAPLQGGTQNQGAQPQQGTQQGGATTDAAPQNAPVEQAPVQQAPADFAAQDSEGRTPLYYIAEHGRDPWLIPYIVNSLKINPYDSGRCTNDFNLNTPNGTAYEEPFLRAIRAANAQIVTGFLSLSAQEFDSNRTYNNWDQTALILAVQEANDAAMTLPPVTDAATRRTLARRLWIVRELSGTPEIDIAHKDIGGNTARDYAMHPDVAAAFDAGVALRVHNAKTLRLGTMRRQKPQP